MAGGAGGRTLATLVNDATLLLRQVHPRFVQRDRVTSQAFTPASGRRKPPLHLRRRSDRARGRLAALHDSSVAGVGGSHGGHSRRMHAPRSPRSPRPGALSGTRCDRFRRPRQKCHQPGRETPPGCRKPARLAIPGACLARPLDEVARDRGQQDPLVLPQPEAVEQAACLRDINALRAPPPPP